MPVVRISWWTGKTKEQRQKLAKKITDAMVEVIREGGTEIWPESIYIIFEELPRENWAFGGELGIHLSPDELIARKKELQKNQISET